MRSGVELKRDAKARQCLVFLWRDLHSRFLLVAPLVFASFFLPPLFHCFSVYTITVVASPAIDSSAQTPLLFPPTGRLYAVLNNRRRPHNRECYPSNSISGGIVFNPTAYVRSFPPASSTYTSVANPQPAFTHPPPWSHSSLPYQVFPHTSQSFYLLAQYQSVTFLLSLVMAHLMLILSHSPMS